MRITNTMLINNMMNNIGKNLTRMDKYESQLSSGKKIQVPSDDAVVAARALKLRTDVAEIEQYKRNITDSQSWLEITEGAVGNVGDVLQRTRELAVQAANGSNTPEDTQKTAQEIKQLRTQLMHLSNSTYAGRYVFSGYKTDEKLIDESTGNFAIDVSNAEAIKYEIGIGDDMNINILGGDLFNAGANAAIGGKSKFIKDMDDFVDALDKGLTNKIGDLIKNFDDNVNNALRVRSDIGARINRLELTENRLQNDTVNFTKLMSENEDVDMAETIMNLKNEENVYRASLSGGAKIIQPSLVDFLR